MRDDEIKYNAKQIYDEHGFICGSDGIDLFILGATMVRDKYESMSISEFTAMKKNNQRDIELEALYDKVDKEPSLHTMR